MFFESERLNNKIIQILKDKFHFTDDIISIIQSNYISQTMDILMDEGADFIGTNRLPKQQRKFDKLITYEKDDSVNLQNIQSLIDLILEMYLQRPDFKTMVDSQISLLRQGYVHDMLASMDEETAYDFFTTLQEVYKEAVHLTSLVALYKQAL